MVYCRGGIEKRDGLPGLCVYVSMWGVGSEKDKWAPQLPFPHLFKKRAAYNIAAATDTSLSLSIPFLYL